MTVVDASTLDALLNLNGKLAETSLEAIIDQAIDSLNIYGAELPNMSGTAGSKTVNLTSKQRGAVLMVARAIYYGFYVGLESTTLAGLTITTPDLLSNSTVLSAIKEAATLMREMEVAYG